jgi:peptidase E
MRMVRRADDRAPQIVALGGGGFWLGESPALDDYLLDVVGAPRPKVCFLGTASGDSEAYVRRFYAEFGKRDCRPSHFPLFSAPPAPAREHLLEQDLIYVGGGMTANMLALWRLHGIDEVLRDAWQSGVVLAGPSAGAICWFEDGITASVGPQIAPLGDGLALLPGSFCPHYRDDDDRTRTYRELVGNQLPAGIGASNDVAVLFRGTEVAEAVSTRPDAGAWHVTEAGEHPLTIRFLNGQTERGAAQ